MPFDYPGEYLMRFDGLDVGRFRTLVVIPKGGRPLRGDEALATTGPGTIEVHELSPTSSSGDLLLHRWQKSNMPTGTPPNIVIVTPDSSGSPGSKLLLRNARAVKWVMKPPGGPHSTGGNAARTEELTIAHEGMIRTR